MRARRWPGKISYQSRQIGNLRLPSTLQHILLLVTTALNRDGEKNCDIPPFTPLGRRTRVYSNYYGHMTSYGRV